MWRDIFIIESQPAGGDAELSKVLRSADLSVSRRSMWSSFSPSHLSQCKESLILANAVPKTAEALNFFVWLRDHSLDVPTFAILPADDPAFVRMAAQVVDDFLLWPPHEEEFRHRVLRVLGPQPETSEEVQQALIGQLGLEKVVGNDPAFLKVLSRVALFGPSDAAVLLTGETGTGKELCARVLHLLSRRRNGPFVPVECGGVPEHLFENEVFGHVRGAFTDAHNEQKGLVSLARHGTLFLDEIDSLSMNMQGKLLRLLQEQTFRPLGSEMFCRADLRIIAASNCDLAALVREKRFRSDLYFRLDVLRVHLPPLRERPTDIATLARRFVDQICVKDGLQRKSLSPACIRKLEIHGWPGNVRELYNAMHRAVLCSSGLEIVPAHIDLQIGGGQASVVHEVQDNTGVESFRKGKLRAIEQFERDYVQRLLEKHVGNVTRAAAEAGKDRRAFGRLVKKYNLARLFPQASQ
jgi:DNA-binding NtrC family response regulator